MPTPVRESILAALKTALDGVAGATAYRNQNIPLKQSNLPALVMFDGDQFTTHETTGQTMHTLEVAVECYVVGSTVGTTGNDLYANVVTAVTADVTLGGYAFDVRETGMSLAEVDEGRASIQLAMLSIEFEVDYTTTEGNPLAIGAA